MKLDKETLLEESKKLPSLPYVISEILQKIEDPATSPAEFQDVIMKDPIITAKTLKLANSAFYGYARAISTISNAVIILGIDTLRSLVITMSAYNVLNKEVKGYRYTENDFWKHSLSTALITRKIASLRSCRNTEAFFIAGLLHDIGKFLLDRFRFLYLENIEEFVRKNKVPDHLAEKAVLGYSHADAGAELANLWKFPQLLIDVILYHHWPLKAVGQNSQYVRTVHVADVLSYEFLDKTPEILNRTVEQEINLSTAEKKEIFATVKDEMELFTEELRKE
jgi:putative nucleotidyltransferase with HDIG domain